MSTTTTLAPAPLTTPQIINLMDLGNDILFLIFNLISFSDRDHGIKAQQATNNTFSLDSIKYPRLYYVSRKSLPVLRLVCKEFDRVAKPLRYKSFAIKDKDLEGEGAERVIEDVKRWCRMAVFGEGLSWSVVEEGYEGLPNLEAISWTHYTPETPPEGQSTPETIPSTLLRPGIKLYLHLTGYYHDLLLSLPPLSLTALHIAQWQRSYNTLDADNLNYGPRFRKFLSDAKNLKFFEYEINRERYGPKSSIPLGTFQPGEKIPPFHSLMLAGFKWNYSFEQARDHWDFSALKMLDVRGLPMHSFFSAINPDDLKNLKLLKLGDFSWTIPDEMWDMGKYAVSNSISKLGRLEELYMSNHTREFEIERFPRSLEVLEFVDNVLWSEPQEEMGWGLKRLEELRELCPRLGSLVVGLDFSKEEFPNLLELLATFPRLKSITIRTTLKSWSPSTPQLPNTPSMREPIKPRINATYTLLTDSASSLYPNGISVVNKQGETVRIELHVGGWKKVAQMGDRPQNWVWEKERMFKFPESRRIGGRSARVEGGW